MIKSHTIQMLIMVGSLSLALGASAQTYDDETTDGVYLYADVYTDAPAPGTCPTHEDVTVTLTGGNRAYGQTSYRNTLHLAPKSALQDNATYDLSEDIVHVGETRSAGCGVFLETTVTHIIGVGLSGANLKFAGMYQGACDYDLDCDSPPTCPTYSVLPQSIVNDYLPCGNYWIQQYASLIRDNGKRECSELPNGLLPFPYVSGKSSVREGCT